MDYSTRQISLLMGLTRKQLTQLMKVHGIRVRTERSTRELAPWFVAKGYGYNEVKAGKVHRRITSEGLAFLSGLTIGGI